jgi:hypothetical protein
MKSRSRAKSLRDLVPATSLKYEKLNCLIKFHANEHTSLLVNILFENNIFSLASSVDDPILVRSSYNRKGERLNKDEVFFRGSALFCCGEYHNIFQKQMDVPYNSLNGLNHLQIIEALESRRKYSFEQFNHRVEPFTDGLKNYRSRVIKHVLDCPNCYAKLSESVDFSSFKKIAESINLFGLNNSADKGFTQSNFDKAISDLESQIAELKAKYPEFVHVSTKRHVVTELAPKLIKPIKEPIQLNMVTLDHATDDSQGETIYDRMRAFAAENGIEIKTMKSA